MLTGIVLFTLRCFVQFPIMKRVMKKLLYLRKQKYTPIKYDEDHKYFLHETV